MLPKYSVKRPMTVIMAVMLVIVLGVIAFTNMTTDLLPSMDFPYIVVLTTYGGASPEKVESVVTDPFESAVSTLGGIENVSSVSAENMSALILEFSYGVDMDSTMIELNSRIDMVMAQLDDSVSQPVYMKINPDMLPVMVISVSNQGMNEIDTSRFVSENVIPALERVGGVASVSASGLVEEEILVTLSTDKINKLNDRILGTVDSELLKTQQQLRDAEEELDSQMELLSSQEREQRDKLNSAQNALNSGMSQIEDGFEQIGTGRDQLQQQLQSLRDQRSQLEALIQGVERMPQLELAIAAAQAAVDQIEAGIPAAREELNGLIERRAALQAELDALEDIPENAEARADLIRRIQALDAAIETAEDMLRRLEERLPDLKSTLEELISQQRMLDEALAALGNPTEAELNTMLSQLDDGITTCESMLLDLNGQEETLNKTQADLLAKQNELNSGKNKLESELSKARDLLNDAQAQLDASQTEFEQARDEAYEKADIGGIITPEMISSILMADNFSLPAGYRNDGGKRYAIPIGDPFSSVEELAGLELFTSEAGDIGAVKLSDVADVEIADNSGEAYVKLNGGNGVLMTVEKQSNVSTSEVSHGLLEAMDQLRAEYSGLNIAPLMDQGIYIDVVIDSVISNLLMGGLLAIIILMVFLRSVRSTFIVAVSIPISLMLAVVLMYFTGVNLNILSLAGLALGVGMLVDNSIVTIENIYRMRLMGMPAAKAALRGARQISGPVFASTLTTVCVFLPIVFTQGITRELFVDMGLTIAYSLLASLVVALTLVPALSSTMLKKKEQQVSKKHEKAANAYGKLLLYTLKHKLPTLIIVVALLGLSVLAVFNMGTEFIPESDFSEVTVNVTPEDENIEDEDLRALSDELMQRIMDMDSVSAVGAMQSVSMMGMSSGGLSMYVVLEEDRDFTSMDFSQRVINIAGDLPCSISANTAMSNMTSFMGSGLSYQICGDDLEELKRIASDVSDIIAGVEGTYNVSSGIEEGAAEMRVTIDKNEALKYGLTIAQVYGEISAALSNETTATTVTLEDKNYPVVVAKDEKMKLDMDGLMDYELAVNVDGKEETIKLSKIAKLSEATGYTSISHDNFVRYVTVTADIDAAHNAGLIGRQIESKLADYNMPEGYYIADEGENKLVTEAMNDVVMMILLAVVLIYAIMAAQFQSLLSPFIVLFTIPLAFTGGILMLWICGFNLSIIALLGMLVLVGVVVNNGIVFVDYANQLRKQGMERREALVQAGKDRLRPILMTALTTILGLFTMLLGVGTGTDMLQPMAAVIVGGLAYATLLTLLFVPILYDWLCKKPPKVVDIGERDEGEEESRIVATESCPENI